MAGGGLFNKSKEIQSSYKQMQTLLKRNLLLFLLSVIGQKQLHLTQGVKFMGIENINSHRLSNQKYHSDFIEEKPSEWKDNSSCMGRDQNTGKIQLN